MAGVHWYVLLLLGSSAFWFSVFGFLLGSSGVGFLVLVFFWCSISNTEEHSEERQKNTKRTPEEKPPPCPLLQLYKPKRQVTSSSIAR